MNSVYRSTMRTSILVVAIVVAMIAAFPVISAENVITDATKIRTITLDDALDFPVMSRIYREDPDTLYVTLRGGGISVFDVSNPDNPVLRTRWDSDEDVEGQDRIGDLLAVVARRGFLLTFDASDNSNLAETGKVRLKTRGNPIEGIRHWFLSVFGNGPFDALHVKLYQGVDERRYAFVTATASGELIAIDVTDPESPIQVGSVDTGISLIEGIYIHRDHAFVGGFGKSGMISAVDVSDPSTMRVVSTLEANSFSQMVSEMSPDRPDLLFAALWGKPGGLAIFNVSSPDAFELIGELVLPELDRANRVKLYGNSAFVPLEDEPGGFAVINIANPRNPKLAFISTAIDGISVPYTLEVNRDHLYIFSSKASTMAVFRLHRELRTNPTVQ